MPRTTIVMLCKCMDVLLCFAFNVMVQQLEMFASTVNQHSTPQIVSIFSCKRLLDITCVV